MPLAELELVGQWIDVPSLPPRSGRSWRRVPAVGAKTGRTRDDGHPAAVHGEFALFTYLRPYLNINAGFLVSALSLRFLVMGLAGFVGTWAISHLLATRLYPLLVGIPALMAVLADLMILLGQGPTALACLLIHWGFFGTAALVGWGT